jgi:hypothetical protein
MLRDYFNRTALDRRWYRDNLLKSLGIDPYEESHEPWVFMRSHLIKGDEEDITLICEGSYDGTLSVRLASGAKRFAGCELEVVAVRAEPIADSLASHDVFSMLLEGKYANLWHVGSINDEEVVIDVRCQRAQHLESGPVYAEVRTVPGETPEASVRGVLLEHRAKEYNRAHRALRMLLKLKDVGRHELKDDQWRGWTPIAENAVKLKAEGLTWGQVSGRTGVPDSTLRRWVNALSGSPRQRGH